MSRPADLQNQSETTENQTISADGIDRRGFLKCMAWAGTGLVWTFAGGVPTSRAFGESARASAQSDFSFVQISDSHIGFNKPANTDVTGTLRAALAKIDAAPRTPDFLIHTGDLTHSSKPAEFDTLNQILAPRRQVFYVPGEHDTSVDDGKLYLERYGKGTKGNGWYSFDHKGVHFIGLVNVVQLEGMGKLGQASTRLAQAGPAWRQEQRPHCPLRTYSSVGCVSRVGLGHLRQRAGLRDDETLRLSHGAQRPHSPGHAKGGRQGDVSHRNVDCLSSARAWLCTIARSDESLRRSSAKRSRNHRREFRRTTP